ncbi:NAD(P)-binding protein [Trichoderma austrokoningii]
MASVPLEGLIVVIGANAYVASTYFGSKLELVEVPNTNTLDAFDGILNDSIIDEITKSNLQLLNAAAKEPSVKIMIITLSLAACALPVTAIEQTATPWNMELALLVLNVNFCIAVSLEITSCRSSSTVIDAVVKGYPAALIILPSQWYVDVEDTALLHLGALTLDDVHYKRLPALLGHSRSIDFLKRSDKKEGFTS